MSETGTDNSLGHDHEHELNPHEIAALIQQNLQDVGAQIRAAISRAVEDSPEKIELESIYASLHDTHDVAGKLLHPTTPTIDSAHPPVRHTSSLDDAHDDHDHEEHSEAHGHDGSHNHHDEQWTWQKFKEKPSEYFFGWNGPVYIPTTWPSKTIWIMGHGFKSIETVSTATKKGMTEGAALAWKNKGKAAEGAIYGTFYLPIVGTIVGAIIGVMGKGESGESSDSHGHGH